jgi:hypothetical protein
VRTRAFVTLIFLMIGNPGCAEMAKPRQPLDRSAKASNYKLLLLIL